MKMYLTIFFLYTSLIAKAGIIDEYFNVYRQTTKTDHAREASILNSYQLKKLTEELTSYYADTLLQIRHKAYYLTFKKGLQSTENRELAVHRLLSGCEDEDGGIIGKNITYLQEYKSNDFDQSAKSKISLLLTNQKKPHYNELVLLAGFVHAGKEVLFQNFLNKSIPEKSKWNIALALSRMGYDEQFEWCMNKAKTLPVNDYFVDYVIPDLVYTRRKVAIDYCLELINNDEKLCQSLNPDIQEKIICAYRIITPIAQVIVDFPVIVDATGDLVTDNYGHTLVVVRKWFSENNQYKTNDQIF